MSITLIFRHMVPALFCATVLAGCGDAGDHFLEFRRTDSSMTAVAKMTITFTSEPSEVSAGAYPVKVAAYDDHGALITVGDYTHPILLGSNDACVIGFSGAEAGSAVTPTFPIPNPNTQVYMQYNPGNASPSCPARLPATVTASDADASTDGAYTF